MEKELLEMATLLFPIPHESCVKVSRVAQNDRARHLSRNFAQRYACSSIITCSPLEHIVDSFLSRAPVGYTKLRCHNQPRTLGHVLTCGQIIAISNDLKLASRAVTRAQ